MSIEEARYTPTDEEFNAEILKRDPDLKAELDIFAVTDPRIMALKVLTIPGYTAQERRYLENALDVTFSVYGDKRRKYSPTYAVLHALALAIPTPSEGTPPIETTLGSLFHDIPEDFFGFSPQAFIDYGSDTVTFVDAMTRQSGETYETRVMRNAEMSSEHPHLLIAKRKARDMRRNALDPYALPDMIQRKPKTRAKMPTILDKYANNYPFLSLYGNEGVPNVGNAIQMGRRANTHPQLIIAR